MQNDEKETIIITPAKSAWFERVKDIAIRGLIILAVIALIVLGAWAIITIVPRAISSVASVGTSLTSLFKPKESLSVSPSSETVQTGTPVELTWDHVSKSAAEGNYILSFPCVTGVTVKIRTASSGDQSIPCERSIGLGTNMKVTLIPVSASARFTDLPFSIVFVKKGETQAAFKADTSITIVNEKIADTTSTTGGTTDNGGTNPTISPTPKPTTKPTPAPVPAGKPDLTITVLSVGVIDANNAFIAKSGVNPGERAAVRFEVANDGSSATGAWSFSALLPTSDERVYNSDTQRSLGAGDRIEYTLGFANLSAAGQNVMTIGVDESERVSESNENNNSATVTFYNNGNGGSYPYPNPPAPYPVPGYGSADLSVRILDQGYLDQSGQYIAGGGSYNGGSYGCTYQNGYQVCNNNQFPYPYGSSGFRRAVRVEVSNLGSYATGAWTYTAQIPGASNTYSTGYNGSSNCYYQNGYQVCPSSVSGGTAVNGVFQGGQQASLLGGQKVTLTLGYDYAQYQSNGSNYFSFTADPYNQISEQNESNNTASISLTY